MNNFNSYASSDYRLALVFCEVTFVGNGKIESGITKSLDHIKVKL